MAVSPASVDGYEHPVVWVLTGQRSAFESGGPELPVFAFHDDIGTAVAQARHKPDHNRQADTLGILEGVTCQLVRLLLGRWLEARDFCKLGQIPAVLLVLR